MADVMMTLGGYRFGLDTAAFQEMNRTTEWNWPKQDVFESRPVLQFTGWGEDTITLPGVIFPEYWGGTGQLDALRALGDAGQPQTLIDGRGNVLGEWVITNVTERQSVFAQRGVGRRQEFTVTLKRFGSDNAAMLPALVSAAAAAVISGNAAAVAGTKAGLAGAVSKAEADAGKSVGSLTAMYATIQSSLSGAREVLGAVGSALGAARSLQSAARDAKSAVNALGQINSLTTAQSAVSGLLSASSRSLQSATMASKTIGKSIDQMTVAGDPPAALAVANSAQVEANRLAVTSTRMHSQIEDTLKGFE